MRKSAPAVSEIKFIQTFLAPRPHRMKKILTDNSINDKGLLKPVKYGSLSRSSSVYTRFWGLSGHDLCGAKSAFDPKADIAANRSFGVFLTPPTMSRTKA